MGKVLTFQPPEPKDFDYIVDEQGVLEGVLGKKVRMVFFKDDPGFLFNDEYLTREELIAFVLLCGVWMDVQDNE